MTVPNHDVCSPSSSGRVACAVTESGRVCGMPIGMPWKPTTSETPRRSTTSRTAATTRSHWTSGSAPCSSRKPVPSASRTWSTTR
ncbi:Uncharacterised protein [Mycobacteroides abscessus]|nr:Uncharacterised protein [Mycobacteroides abscessus]